jgi:ABC-type Fe3+-hydroxamate transport system substrate-binding protein
MSASNQEIIIVTDQMGRSVSVPAFPQRIISLVPSQTELLYDLGLDNRIIGQTVFCIYPKDSRKSKANVGGTKKLRIEAIKALEPDLIIGNKEENEREQIEELAKHFPVWMSDIYTLADACQMITMVGALTQASGFAKQITENITSGFARIRPTKQREVIYLIWQQPYIAVGSPTFINDMLGRCGLVNTITAEEGRYPQIDEKYIQNKKPEYIFLSSEPFPFKEKHREEIQQQFPDSKVMLVDGELFSWYGSRLIKSVNYLEDLLIELL